MMTTTLDKPGTVMPDGTIYAGVSPDTGKPMYTMRRDAPLACTFNEAGKYGIETRCAWPQGLARALQGRVERAIRQSRGDRRLRHDGLKPRRLVLVVLTQGQLLRVGAALQ